MKNTLRNLALRFYIKEMYQEGCIKPEDMHDHDLDFIANMHIFDIWTMSYKHIDISRALLKMKRYEN